jgi:predicted deacetylase
MRKSSGMAECGLVVSIHDVAPPFAEECAALWAMCVARDIHPALFVVPHWHGAWPLGDHARFARWVAERQAAGAECFLHGFRHDEIGVRRSWSAALRAIGRTAGEGEFLSLDYEAAMTRMHRGARALASASIDPVGFVAPAWLDTADTRRAARDLGFTITEDATGIVALRSGAQVAAPAVRWSARTSARAATSCVVARTRRYLHANEPVVRVALHPRDLHHRAVAESLRGALQWWRRDRSVVTYQQVLSRGLLT